MFPGEQLAALLGVELSEPAKPIEATRETPEAGCSYIFPRQGTVRGRVDIELHDAVDYEIVRRGKEGFGPVTEIAGLGDGAWMDETPDGWDEVWVLRRGDVALKVMADSPELARKVADWAAQRL